MRHTYTPYGETWYVSSTTEKYKFTGQEEDAETGFYNYGARHYDPALARFVSADPVGSKYEDPQSLNRYSYTLNNPVLYVDPTGNTAFFWHGWYTFNAERAAGEGLGRSTSMGLQSLWVDFSHFSGFRSASGYANEHVMVGYYTMDGKEEWQESYQAVSASIDRYWNAMDQKKLSLAYHIAQDFASVDHPGQNFSKKSLSLKTLHFLDDCARPSMESRKNLEGWSATTKQMSLLYGKDYYTWGSNPPDEYSSPKEYSRSYLDSVTDMIGTFTDTARDFYSNPPQQPTITAPDFWFW